jgi:hypothetical protein
MCAKLTCRDGAIEPPEMNCAEQLGIQSQGAETRSGVIVGTVACGMKEKKRRRQETRLEIFMVVKVLSQLVFGWASVRGLSTPRASTLNITRAT